MNLRRILGITLVATVGTGVTLSVVKSKHAWQPSQVITAQAVTVPAIVRSLRPTYPYSIIPGGVYSRRELDAQLHRDPTARAHYADFDVEKAELVRSEGEHFAFVSFRQHGQVFWTKNKIRIPKGELLLTDGHHLARTRCGNRVSDRRPPSAATSPNEPVAELTMPTAVGPTVNDARIGFSQPPITEPAVPDRAASTISQPLTAGETQLNAAIGPTPWTSLDIPFTPAKKEGLSDGLLPSLSNIVGAPFPYTGPRSSPSVPTPVPPSTSGTGGSTPNGGVPVPVIPITPLPITPVPEPACGILVGSALLFAGVKMRTRRKGC